MRVITSKVVATAMTKHANWKVGLKLWLDVFNVSRLRFESFSQIRTLWKNTSGWNVDRIPAHRLRPRGQKGPLDIYVFDVHKNACRIIVWGSPRAHTLFLHAVYSHAEYDAWCKQLVK